MGQHIVMVLSLSFCAFLLYQHVHLRKDIKKMRDTAQEIQAGNFNLRFRLCTPRKDTLDLAAELNRLTECFQNSLARTAFLEKERQQMISNISHDLRTPLTSLLGYIEALRLDKNLSDQEKTDFLRIAAQKGNDLLRLIQEFFELARMEEDQEAPSMQKIDIAELARTVLLDFYFEFTQLNITPITEIPEHQIDIEGTLSGDTLEDYFLKLTGGDMQ